jgi:hypothetical protein
LTNDTITAKYPMRFRHRPISILVVGLITCPWIGDGVRRALPGHATDPFVIVPAIVWAVVVAYLPFHIWRSWFLAAEYRHTGESLEQISPVLKRRKQASLIELRECLSFTYGNRVHAQAGYILVGKDGQRITVIEALPIWTQITKHLGETPTRPAPLLQRPLS